MIEEQGRVVAVGSGFVRVEVVRQSSCSSCTAQQGCGQHLVEKYKPSLSFSCINAITPLALRKGDRVVVGIPEGSLLKAASLIYLFPLSLMMMGVWFASLAGMADWLLFLIAGLLLLCGFGVVRIIGKGSADMCNVEVLRVLSSEGFYLSGTRKREKTSL